MKKNLNIAYLNGAEGMIRRAVGGGGSGSGDSGDNGESGGGNQIEYYNVNTLNALIYFSTKIKTKDEYNDIWITSTGKWVYEMLETGDKGNLIRAIAVQYPIEDYITGDDPMILNNFEEAVNLLALNILDFTPITKEEFYSLE